MHAHGIQVPHDGLLFHLVDRGQGTPLVVLHGLGGDVSQPLALFLPPPGFRLLSFDFRGHGQTRPLGPVEALTIQRFADDLRALLDHLGIARAIVGGISLGAAVALNFADRFPERLLGLILSRPAWLDEPGPEHLGLFRWISALIADHGPVEGERRFVDLPGFARLRAEFPDAAQSLVSHFRHSRAAETAAKFERIARDGPGVPRAHWGRITVPTLVLGNALDPIHPQAYAQELAGVIPRSTYRELTPKAVSFLDHGLDVHHALDEFLRAAFATPDPGPS